jgi:hypothetical protein
VTTYFTFEVEETTSPPERFRILRPYEVESIDLVNEAARLFYFGKKGWEEPWPLTFTIRTVTGTVVIRAHVFILSAQPHFDIIRIP